MNREKLFSIAVQVSRFFLIALFIGDVGAKASKPYWFVSDISSFVGGHWAIHAAVIMLLAEITAIVLLLVPRTIRAAGLWTIIMLVVFAAYGFYYVYALRGGAPNCQCFGGIVANLLGISTMWRSLVLFIPAAICAKSSRRDRGKSPTEPSQNDSPILN